ncbi:innexin unc-7 [Patella vulgata]|uniref:innexin unc-7 n=1 Tax=Patella vulgata TaxID=6465 RepID=UPI002180985A|nr:innexin unc-7 [Patella vulgata]XP_050409217.1 innexin unc-7 [Patella vulgata]
MADRIHRPYFDFSEELNFFWTSLILLLFVSMVTVLRYVFLTSLITCWTPAQFALQHNVYTHQECWNQDRVMVDGFDNLMPDHEFRPNSFNDKTFHRWIPIVLVFMMLGFQIPRAFKIMTDLLLGSPTAMVREDIGTDPRTDRAQELADTIKEAGERNRVIRTMIFFLVKILVGLNIIIQMSFVKWYFRDSVQIIGRNNETVVTPVHMFPKTIRCHFEIRQMHNVHDYDVQCKMPVNYLLEQFLYIFWFWLLGVGIYTGLVFITQLASLIIPPFVRLRFRGIIPDKDLSQRGFCFDDALLYLSDIEHSSGLSMAREVAVKLWISPPLVQPGIGAHNPHIVQNPVRQDVLKTL